MRAPARRLVVLVAATVAGCGITPTFTTGYSVSNAPPAQRPAGSLAVTQFVDARPPRVYTTAGYSLLTAVPLLPYVSMPWERLDESVNLLSDEVQVAGTPEVPLAPPFTSYAYPVSVPRAIADDLAGSGLFASVAYVGNEQPAGYDYVLSGQLRASPLVSTGTSYGLGLPGELLWALALPMQKTSADVVVDLSLADAQTGHVVWHDRLSSEVSRIATVYNDNLYYGSAGVWSFSMLQLQPDVTMVDRLSLFQWHFESLRRSMAAAKPKLAHALGNR